MSRASSGPGLHGKAALLALLPLLVWGAWKTGDARRSEADRKAVTVAVEHDAPASITLSHAIGGTATITDIENESEEAVHVSVPVEWVRGEVRGAPLSALVSDGPDFGFRRWLIPGGATVSFDAIDPWHELTVHNPTGVVLKVRVITVDLETNVTHDVTRFVQKEDLQLDVADAFAD